MRNEIIINGQKYQKVKNKEKESKNIDGQSGILVIMLVLILFTVLCILFEEYLTGVLSMICVFICGFIGIDGFIDIKDRLNELNK